MTEYSYDYWQARQRGETPPINDGIAHPGFYRTRAKPPKGAKYKDQPWLPVAIFEHEGELIATVGEETADPAKIWLHCAENDISEDAYRIALATGRWDDVEPAAAPKPAAPDAPPPMGHNAPADPADEVKDQIESAKASLKDYEKITTDDQAARAQSLRSRLLELAREVFKLHKVEKEPHLEAGKAVDARWKPLEKDAKAAADQIAEALSDFFTEKDRANKAAEAAAQAAAAKAKPSEAPAPWSAPAAPPHQVKGGYGRAANIKPVKVVTGVADWEALWGFLKTHPELRRLMEQLAQRAVDAGHDVPGVTIEERQKVA